MQALERMQSLEPRLPRACPFLFRDLAPSGKEVRSSEVARKQKTAPDSMAVTRPSDSKDALTLHCTWAIARCALGAREQGLLDIHNSSLAKSNVETCQVGPYLCLGPLGANLVPLPDCVEARGPPRRRRNSLPTELGAATQGDPRKIEVLAGKHVSRFCSTLPVSQELLQEVSNIEAPRACLISR